MTSKTPKNPTSTVVVEEVSRAIRTINPETLAPIVAGILTSRIFQGEATQRHFYTPEQGKDKGKEFSLGPTTTRFHTVDHFEVLDPLLQQGYEVKDMLVGKGGLVQNTVLVPAKAKSFKDPIVWDKPLWSIEKEPVLTESIVVRTAIAPGKGISIQRGLFRMICTNGLVSEILGLGGGRWSHTNYSPERAGDAMNFEPLTNKTVLGPVAGTPYGAARFAEILENQMKGTDDDVIPYYIRNSLTPILRMPKWYLEKFIANLRLISIMDTQGRGVTALDIVNAVTNPINQQREEDAEVAAIRPLLRSSSIIKGTAQFIGILSL